MKVLAAFLFPHSSGACYHVTLRPNHQDLFGSPEDRKALNDIAAEVQQAPSVESYD